MSRARREVFRFLIVGTTTVLIDLAVYRLTMLAGLAVSLAKAFGFLTGTVFAYIANRTWTFSAAGGGPIGGELLRFAGVYGGSLVANVVVNSALLMLFGRSELALAVAFVVATGASAMLNFLGMKFLVFRYVNA
jgi:putative flippase GtrA